MFCRILLLLSLLTVTCVCQESALFLGIDRVFDPPYVEYIKGKKVGLVTNQTGVNRQLISTIALFKERQKSAAFELKVLFSPEHGLYGEGYANEKIAHGKTDEGIPILSLHGQSKRPTSEMLKGLDVIVYDIQDIGSRSYTFAATLFYIMEEAAKNGIEVVVLDRPNPINGLVVDGPLLDTGERSFLGYVNVPYCHGMTIGELALFFNKEYAIGCAVHVVPMKGWKRSMSFCDTGLNWVPTSPNIPEATTALYYPMTGILGEASFVSIGIGYTLPFKVIGAPWIDPEKFAKVLRWQRLPGVSFYPIRFKPFSGKFSGESCGGVLIIVHAPELFLPVTSQFAIIGVLKRIYPQQCKESFAQLDAVHASLITHVCGTKRVLRILQDPKGNFADFCTKYQGDLQEFLKIRQNYLLY